MPVSKPFAIATEGPTIDGRNISRDWILQMAKSYDPKVYTAVINLEHYLSAVPDSIFSAYGKVMSLATRETEIMGEKKLQLTAVVDVSQAAADLQKSGKKAFSSMEVRDNFINKGFAYLTGLAFTDTPASIGTEAMKFSAFSNGGKDCVFAFGAELDMEFEDAAPVASIGETLLTKVKELLSGKSKDDANQFADIRQAVEALAGSQKEVLEKFAAMEKALDDATKTLQGFTATQAEDRKAIADLREQFDRAPDGSPQRPPATGASGSAQVTDC